MKMISFSESEIVSETAALIDRRVDAVIAKKKQCVLALSGGKSPEDLYACLAEKLEGKNIKIILVDERVVPIEDERSNTAFVKKYFPHLTPYIVQGGDRLEQSQVVLDRFERIDIAIMGLGTDGHTASLFHLDDLLLKGRLVQTHKDGEEIDRFSLSYDEILKISELIFYVPGKDKGKINEKMAKYESAQNYPAGRIIWKHSDVSFIATE